MYDTHCLRTTASFYPLKTLLANAVEKNRIIRTPGGKGFIKDKKDSLAHAVLAIFIEYEAVV